MLRYFTLACLLLVFTCSPLVLAEDKTTAAEPDFLNWAIICGNKEMKLSKLAGSRSDNDKVKEFAQRVINDHKSMSEELLKHAGDRKEAIAAGTEKDTRDAIARLSRLRGSEFDQAYLQLMVEDHEKAIKRFETFTKEERGNADLRKAAQKALPTIREHLAEAKKLQASVKER